MRRRPQMLLDLISLDRQSHRPIQRQIYDALCSLILDGRLAANTRLPSSRDLAELLGVSRNTILAAYDNLLAEGYVESRFGSGTWVRDLPKRPARSNKARSAASLAKLSARGEAMVAQKKELLVPGQIAFHAGFPDVPNFPFSTWSRLVKRYALPTRRSFWLSFIRWLCALRSAVSHYLSVSRGVECDADQIIIVAGAQSAFDLCARLLLDPGDCYYCEDPGYSGSFHAFNNAGGIPQPIHVDADNWHLPPETGKPPSVIIVTPACHWPMGHAMKLETRLQILQRAKNCGAWIIEDDYDGEYRYRGKPIPALQGMDTSDRVIYVGTFAKTMFPALRIGFAVVPKRVSSAFVTAVGTTGAHPHFLCKLHSLILSRRAISPNTWHE